MKYFKGFQIDLQKSKEMKIVFHKTCFTVHDKNNNIVYEEHEDGRWTYREFDEFGRKYYWENSNRFHCRYYFNELGQVRRCINSDCSYNHFYDEDGNRIGYDINYYWEE